jgi:hypothetical protein
MALIGELVVPVVVVGDPTGVGTRQHRVGFDPEWLESVVLMPDGGLVASEPLAAASESGALPPRDSASRQQGKMAARPQADLPATISDLVVRIREEQAYNAAKAAQGGGAYRQGMHDGLKFAEDALVDILKQYAGGLELPEASASVRRMDA